MKVRDEVCGMELVAEEAAATIRFNGRTYHFCAERCKRLFKDHPERYVTIEPGG